MGDEANAEKRGSSSWERCAVAAEVNGRRVNEAIERGTGEEGAVFVCECGHLGCSTTIWLSLADYEAVRTNFDRFLVAPGHEIDRVEHVAERHSGHVVVVKREGQASEMAAASSERPG